MSAKFTIDARALMAAGADGIADLVDSKGDLVLSFMRRGAPTDTLALLKSLGKEVSGDGASRVNRVGVDASFTLQTPKGPRHPDDYAMLVEKGTSKMAAQPFIGPALAQAMVAR